jgi:2-amino-4-hydroxy-6-hydroxymethyldihydropteridine diphosphokinase
LNAELAYIALGANLGDPEQAIRDAIERIRALGVITAVSSIHVTAPVGGPPNQPDYRNAVLALRTALPPEELLDRLLAIERDMGRVRRERWGPRIIDLDLLTYSDRVIDTTTLTLPHPRMNERPFVLEPLAEIRDK